MIAHVLFTLFVFLFAHSGVQHLWVVVLFCFLRLVSSVPYVASISGLSIFGCPFGIL